MTARRVVGLNRRIRGLPTPAAAPQHPYFHGARAQQRDIHRAARGWPWSLWPAALGGRGGTGRRTGFRFQRRKACGFKSLRPHHHFRIAGLQELEHEHDLTMQVTQTLSEGLKREFRVVVPAGELDTKVNTRLDELKGTVRINGFRPGKVPVGHLKRLYGRSAMAEAI